MYVLIQRVIFILLNISIVISIQEYRASSKTLYVENEPNTGGKLIVLHNTGSRLTPRLLRSKRFSLNSEPELQTNKTNINSWTTYLNISYKQLIYWIKSNVVICLAKGISPKNKSLPSLLFISYDYGRTFINKTESFMLGDTNTYSYALLDTFINHPKYLQSCVFIDQTNRKLFYTNDNGETIRSSDLSFHPSELKFHEECPEKYVILDKLDIDRKLYLTVDSGITFKTILSSVKSFFWSIKPGFSKVFYVERGNPIGVGTVFSAKDPNDLVNSDVLFEDVKDLEMKGDYLFATKQAKESNSSTLFISYKTGPFLKAVFKTDLEIRKFHIADVTDKRIFISVLHNESLVNLYVSVSKGVNLQYDFILSMDQIFSYFPDGNWKHSWVGLVTEDIFTDMYQVQGVKGIYIASKVDSRAPSDDIKLEHLTSFITFDHGATWSLIKAPIEDENGEKLNCRIEDSCSLHTFQKFGQLYPLTKSAMIMSSKSAPGIIMATGVIGTSMKGFPGVYLSRDAGLTWKKVFNDYHFYNIGDHGGVLTAVKYFKSNKLFYSTNEGIDWKSYEFSSEDLCVSGLVAESGEKTTMFTILTRKRHQWIIITIDLMNAFTRNCIQDDYTIWSPSLNFSSTFEESRNVFKRRLAYSNCYNGINYNGCVTAVC